MHTGGEPLRVIIDGFPDLQGNNILEYRQDIKANFDHLRRALMHEPRGHADMYGCLLVPPNDEAADFGILFLHNAGYSTMCGHAIIAITKLVVEMGWVKAGEEETRVTIDAPCGRIEACAKMSGDRVHSVYFYGVPSFVVALGEEVNVTGLGPVKYDLAYGGAFYAYVQASDVDLQLIPEQYNRIITLGTAIKRAIIGQKKNMVHPFESDLSFLYGTIFVGDPVSEGIDSRNVCVFADGEVDRCPTGSGVSGRMSIHYLKKEIAVGEEMTVESIIGSVFTASVHRITSYGPFDAVVPRVEGKAYITGRHEFFIDPEDPFRHGFFLR